MGDSEAAAVLRRVLSDPIYNKTLRKEVGRGELDYEVYLRTRELLALQTPANELVVPDELLFQVMHQTQELWLKCAAFEIVTLVEQIEGDAMFAALDALDRIVSMTRVLADQIRVMFTLSPSRFEVIRRSLGNGSGLESPGYNHLLAAADVAESSLRRLLARRGTTLIEIYRDPQAHADVHRLVEKFVDWDSAFQSWLIEHFMLVRRTIGIDKTVRALDGFPTVALGARMTKPLFPDLWNVRVEMTRAWSRPGGYLPGAPRTSGEPSGPGLEEEGASPSSRLVISVEEAAGEPPAPASASTADADRERTETISVLPLVQLDELRGEFPLLARCIYLNSNATGANPRAAKAVLDTYWRTVENWRDEHWERWGGELGAYTDELSELIGAPPGSVVCDVNLGTLFSRVLSCFDYRERPKIVTTDLEFPSMPFAIGAFQRYGAVPVVVPSRDGIEIDVEAVVAAIDERTQLVCVSHATFGTGALLDVAPIVKRAREVGALVVLDAYQSVGIVPIDVAALGVDFLLGGAHKWLCGSYESAFLYVRPSLCAQLQPAAAGWFSAADPMSFQVQSDRADGARRFAGGTPAVLPVLFSRPGLAIVREIGPSVIRDLSLAHTDRIMARADAAGIPVASPRGHARRGGIVTLRFPGDAAVASSLIANDFVCSYRGGLRIAPHFYNTSEEIDRFMTELARRAGEAS